jgi:hypothetical protein
VTFVAVDFLGLKIYGSNVSADGSSADGAWLLLQQYCEEITNHNFIRKLEVRLLYL